MNSLPKYVQFDQTSSKMCVVCNKPAINPQMRRHGLKCETCVGTSSAYNYLVQQGPWMNRSPSINPTEKRSRRYTKHTPLLGG